MWTGTATDVVCTTAPDAVRGVAQQRHRRTLSAEGVPEVMSEYLSGVAVLMLVLSPLFIPIAVTIIGPVRRWSSSAVHSSRTHRSRSSDESIGYLARQVSEPS